MAEFEEVSGLLKYIKDELDDPAREDKVCLWLVFASNTSGKTRLAETFREENSETVLCYNAFFEDYFHWDNENLVLLLDKNSWVLKLIEDEGLEPDIVGNFKKLTSSKLEPEFDFDKGIVRFGFLTGDDNNIDRIKISRGEESLFIWCVFYTILEKAIGILAENPEERSTHIFDDIKYIVIDDPVSSMDDTRIITVALGLVYLVKQMNGLKNKLKILITTHHCLFYNILHGKTSRKLGGVGRKNYMLTKLAGNKFAITEQMSDSPFAYHIFLLKDIKRAVNAGDVQKYHFNFFRAILEKTANFLGYSGGWSTLLEENADKPLLVQLLNQYSHDSLAEIERGPLQLDEQELFKTAFSAFFEKFNWSCSND